MSSLLPLLGWAVLPSYATYFIQSIYYGLTIRAGDPRPLPNTPRYELHRNRIFNTVVVSYLLFTLYETFYQVQVAGDYYKALGVTPFADVKTIKSKFRRLAAKHHPDKAGGGAGSEIYFMFLRQAEETLADPVKRFGYDRFGPDIQKWGELSTMRDVFLASLTRSVIPSYVIGFVMMLMLNWLWWSNWGRYWRFYTFAALLTLELGLITSPQAVFMPTTYLPEVISAWLPQETFYLLPFQVLTLARRFSVMLHIFISQVAPQSSKNATGSGDISRQTIQQISQLVQTSRQTDMEATRALQLGLAPFRGDRDSIPVLRRGMQEGLILAGVRSSPGVKKAIVEVVERRQAEKGVKGE